MKPTQILIVDDDPSIRKFVRANLEARNYGVLLAGDGEEGLQIVEKELPDLIILDIMMPQMDGFEVCRRVREWSQIPIIMLSARDDEDDKVKCLDSGADDYLTKPFSLKELLSRIKAILRRSEQGVGQPKVQCGDLEVDLVQNTISLKGQVVDLTPTEYQILSYLAVNAGRVITFQQLAEKVSGDACIESNHLIQVNINRLRKKLGDSSKEAKYIQTKYGIGYVMAKGD
jgi:two-component system KDP operon response regulator KdpE